MSAGPLFTIISVNENIFSDKKNDKDIEYFVCFILPTQTGSATDGQNELCFCVFIKIRERHQRT